MRLSRTVFEILPLIFQKIKEVTWQWPRPFQGQFVVRRLGLAMFKPHTKFKVFTITCNDEMKGNAKCKNKFSFWATLWGLRGNARDSSMARWNAHCWLSISDNLTFLASSHGCGTIKRNLSKSAFYEGVGHFERNFLVDGDIAAIRLWTVS